MSKTNITDAISEEYNNIAETLYIESIPGLKEELLKAKNEPDSEFIDEDKLYIQYRLKEKEK